MVACEYARAARRLHPAHADVVLDGDWNPAQRRLTGCVLLIDGVLRLRRAAPRFIRARLSVQLFRASYRARAVYLQGGVERVVQPFGGGYRARGNGTRRRRAV